MALNYDFQVKKGIVFTRTFACQDASGNPINLTGYTVVNMSIRSKPSSKEGLLLATVVPTISNATAGQVTITISSSVTSTFNFDVAYYDLIIVDPSGDGFIVSYGQVLPSDCVSL